MFLTIGLVQIKNKVEKLKVARDYSFLSDDAEFPVHAKEPPRRNVSVPTSGMLLLHCIESVYYL